MEGGDRSCRHTCRCQHAVSDADIRRIALQSEATSVVAKLRAAFEESHHWPNVFLAEGDGLVRRVREVLAPFSEMERRSVRAVVVGADGQLDVWSSRPVDDLLTSIETQWLPRLLNEQAVHCVMQPIVTAGGGRVHGYEALVRTNASFGEYRPDQIIAAAKAHDALLRFDQIARCAAITGCFPKLGAGERLFVNFFPTTIYDPSICLRTTFAAAERIGADLSRLTFEVVESEEFPDIDHLRWVLDAYRDAGARVALDDLGAGNTSIVYIDELNPDYIKIDKKVLKSAMRSGHFNILQGLASHAHDKGIAVIAEGVETEEEMHIVRRLEIEFAQGYYIGKPSEQPMRAVGPGRGAAA